MTNRENEAFDLFIDIFTDTRKCRSMFDDAELLQFMREGVNPVFLANNNDQKAREEDEKYAAEDEDEARARQLGVSIEEYQNGGRD